MKHLIVIEGPTASGKTSLSIALAKKFNTCILSADSRQFYQELSIGTAKPSLEEQEGIKHYFIDSHQLKDEVSAAQYEKEALAILETEFQDKNHIILVGGSGMFIDALCIGLDNIPASNELRSTIEHELSEKGLEFLLSELKTKDPEYYAIVDKQNPVRVIRAIEVIRLSGQTYTSLRLKKPAERPFKVHRFVIDHDREKLYDRINLRVDIMIDNGLVEEAKGVECLKGLSSLNTVGYKELFEYFEGNSKLDEAVENIKRNSRRYAKRQLTWFRRHEDAKWIAYSDNESMVKEIMSNF